MKLFIATLYLLTTILSAAFHSQIDAFNTKSKAVVELSNSTDCCSTDSTHNQSDSECNVCHLGHCSSILAVNIASDLNLFAQTYPIVSVRQNLKNYHFEILRPPIV